MAEDERKAVSLKESFDRLVEVVVSRKYTLDQGYQQIGGGGGQDGEGGGGETAGKQVRY